MAGVWALRTSGRFSVTVGDHAAHVAAGRRREASGVSRLDAVVDAA